MALNNIICIAGPTASGKTALAVELAKELGGEVVSCDSMQVYKRMDIGTAKPTLEERQGIVHHMIDVAEPEEDFSVSRYCEMATPIVDDILARGKTVIIAGGAKNLGGLIARDLAAHAIPIDLWRDDDPSLPDDSLAWHGGAFVGGIPPRRDERSLSYEDVHDYMNTLLAETRRAQDAEGDGTGR